MTADSVFAMAEIRNSFLYIKNICKQDIDSPFRIALYKTAIHRAF